MVHILTVTLERPVGENEAEKIRTAITALRGVQHVTYGQIDRVTAEARWASQRVYEEICEEVTKALYEAGVQRSLDIEVLSEIQQVPNRPKSNRPKSKLVGVGG